MRQRFFRWPTMLRATFIFDWPRMRTYKVVGNSRILWPRRSRRARVSETPRKAHFFQFQVGYGAAAVDAEAARIRVQLVAQDFAVEPRRALGENQAPLGNVHDAATLGMVGRGCNEIDIRCQQRDHVHEFVGVVGAIAVHGADNFIRSVADASKYGRRDAAVDFILYQSTILAGSEQAIEEFPGSVGNCHRRRRRSGGRSPWPGVC